MKRILKKDMDDKTKNLVDNNKIYSTFPSGTCFQGFRKKTIETPMGQIKCSIKGATYENGINCGSTLQYHQI
ncbi:MAG: hypothetical protein ACTSXG_01590 [Alphaproteobacteria bacterium]